MKDNYNLGTTISFLSNLEQNNNREWFAEHKGEYQQAWDEMINFADALLSEMQQHDQIVTPTGKKSLFRIYRDVRFSKNKLPYKNNLGGGFRRATKFLRGGYYFQIQPGNCFVAGGFWGPNSQDLLHIRKQIAMDPDPLREVLADKDFKKNFGTLEGEQLKTAPKGFDKEDPAIDLLRYKQFVIYKSFSDKETKSKDFHKKMAEGFVAMRPFFDYMTDILTTDLNGEERRDLY
ncbi:MAG: DUF2461 domain-containing protein [Cyclobacteriaceae bacterium]